MELMDIDDDCSLKMELCLRRTIRVKSLKAGEKLLGQIMADYSQRKLTNNGESLNV